MANKPEASVNPPIRTRVTSNEAGQAQPALAANVVSIAQELGGFVATFYSVPSDALEAPSVQEQIQSQKDRPAGGFIDVTLEVQPAAKVFLPITTVSGLIQLLTDNLRAWNESYARELRSYLDGGKSTPAAAPAKKEG
ncbi:MAG TPA: hypothetical protein VIV57_22625 [Anaeromyxobacter sp.]